MKQENERSLRFSFIDQWEKQAAIHPPLPPASTGDNVTLDTALSPTQGKVWGISANPELGMCRLQTFSFVLSTPGDPLAPLQDNSQQEFRVQVQLLSLVLQKLLSPTHRSFSAAPFVTYLLPKVTAQPPSLDAGTYWGSCFIAYFLQVGFKADFVLLKRWGKLICT